MNFILKKLSELSEEEQKRFKNSAFIASNLLNWKYSSGSIAYNREYFGGNFKDNSIVLFAGKEPIAFINIIMNGNVSFFNMPVEVFLNEDYAYKRAVNLLIEYLTSLMQNKCLCKMYYNKHIAYELYARKDISVNVGNEYSYQINLNKTLEEIKSETRKSYRSLINWGLKNIDYKIIDSSVDYEEEFWKFKDFHFKTAGRMTRSLRSWELQLEMLKNDEAILINGYLEKDLVSSALYFLGEKASYAVGVYDRDLMAQGKGLAHGSVFKAIEHLKKRNCKSLHLISWEEENQLTDKEIKILNFKRGYTNSLISRTLISIGNEI